MGNFIDLTGQRFGRLTVVERAENSKSGKARWVCRCDCGETIIAFAYNLKRGNTQSCGCWQKVQASISNRSHGESKTRLYKIWKGVMKRCYNPNASSFVHYGGRGIFVCEEWRRSFVKFREWAIAAGYTDSLTIDRVDVNGPYSPENCRWATMTEQCNNRTSNHTVTFKGETHTLKEWETITGVKWGTIWARLQAGWPVERALTEPVQDKHHRKSK